MTPLRTNFDKKERLDLLRKAQAHTTASYAGFSIKVAPPFVREHPEVDRVQLLYETVEMDPAVVRILRAYPEVADRLLDDVEEELERAIEEEERNQLQTDNLRRFEKLVDDAWGEPVESVILMDGGGDTYDYGCVTPMVVELNFSGAKWRFSNPRPAPEEDEV